MPASLFLAVEVRWRAGRVAQSSRTPVSADRFPIERVAWPTRSATVHASSGMVRTVIADQNIFRAMKRLARIVGALALTAVLAGGPAAAEGRGHGQGGGRWEREGGRWGP